MTIEQEKLDGVWILKASGKIGSSDFDQVVPQMKATLRSPEPLRLVVDYGAAEGLTFSGWLREVYELIRLFPLRKAYGRAAVLTANNFTDGFMEVEDWFQPNLETKFFPSSEREAAIAWAKAAITPEAD